MFVDQLRFRRGGTVVQPWSGAAADPDEALSLVAWLLLVRAFVRSDSSNLAFYAGQRRLALETESYKLGETLRDSVSACHCFGRNEYWFGSPLDRETGFHWDESFLIDSRLSASTGHRNDLALACERCPPAGEAV